MSYVLGGPIKAKKNWPDSSYHSFFSNTIIKKKSDLTFFIFLENALLLKPQLKNKKKKKSKKNNKKMVILILTMMINYGKMISKVMIQVMVILRMKKQQVFFRKMILIMKIQVPKAVMKMNNHLFDNHNVIPMVRMKLSIHYCRIQKSLYSIYYNGTPIQ